MQLMRCIISLSLFGYAFGVIVHENVVFHKVNEITTTRARWLVTFVQDLRPFQYFLTKLSNDIEQAANITDVIIDHYTGRSYGRFVGTIKSLRKEVKSLQDTQAGIIQSYSDYRSLGSREKRSLLPFVGQAFSFLFGTVSEADIENVRRGLADLYSNQQDIVHVLEEQMSILNVSRVQIAENRQAIVNLVICVNRFDLRIRKLTEAIQKRFEQTEMFIDIYSQIDIILSEIKDTVQRATFYLENLRLELNMLSLNHLSPSTITPKNLRKLLLDIKTRLPSSLKLPEDPMANIWYFYQTLTCKTILDGDKVLVIISVPLLDFHGEFEVYKVYNLPLPMHQNLSDGSTLPGMIARYDIEYQAILINKDRTRYALLEADEIHKCSNTVVKYCSPRYAILPVNLNHLCVLAFFTKDDKKINRFCRRVVEPNAMLPMATYISAGRWVVSTQEKLTFSVVCLGSAGQGSQLTQQSQSVSPPLGVIQLKPGCHGSNNFLSLPPYYEYEGHFSAIDPLTTLLDLHNMSKFRVWEPFKEALPNFTKLELPENLQTIEQISMGDLIARLRNLRKVDVSSTSWPTWAYIIINIGVSVLIGCIIYMYCRFYKGKKKRVHILTCCRRLAILSGNETNANPDELNGQTKVSYQGREETVMFLGSDSSSAPGNKDTSPHEDEGMLQRLYPNLPLAGNKHSSSS